MDAIVRAFEESEVVVDIEQYTFCLIRQSHPDWPAEMVISHTKELIKQATKISDRREKKKLKSLANIKENAETIVKETHVPRNPVSTGYPKSAQTIQRFDLTVNMQNYYCTVNQNSQIQPKVQEQMNVTVIHYPKSNYQSLQNDNVRKFGLQNSQQFNRNPYYSDRNWKGQTSCNDVRKQYNSKINGRRGFYKYKTKYYNPANRERLV